jgi:hypothetical protein
MWHRQRNTGLQAAQQVSGLDSSILAQGRRFDFTAEPNDWLIRWVRGDNICHSGHIVKGKLNSAIRRGSQIATVGSQHNKPFKLTAFVSVTALADATAAPEPPAAKRQGVRQNELRMIPALLSRLG